MCDHVLQNHFKARICSNKSIVYNTRFSQLFEALLRIIELLKRYQCLIEAESLTQLFQEMFPMWLSSIEIAFTRQLDSAHAVDDISSLTGYNLSLADSDEEGSQMLRVIDSLLQRSMSLLSMPSLDADLHQLFWDVVVRIGRHAASLIQSACSRDIQYVLVVEAGMADSDADACVAACVHPLPPAQFLSDLDASRKGIGDSYISSTSWGRVLTTFSSPLHFLTPAILSRAGFAHDIARHVREFATYELDKSEDPIIALLPHAPLMSLAEDLVNTFNHAFYMALNMLTAVSLKSIEYILAQEDINVQSVADDIYRTCQGMRDLVCPDLVRPVMDPAASSHACALIFQAVSKACVMAAMQLNSLDIDSISFLDALQVKLKVQLSAFLPVFDQDELGINGDRYSVPTYSDMFNSITRRGVKDDGGVGLLLMPTLDLIFEYTQMRNGKVGLPQIGIRDVQAILIRRARLSDPQALEFLQSHAEEPGNWRRKFDVLDSETGVMVSSCRMRHISSQIQKTSVIPSSVSWFHGFFVLTKFHCAFVQDDAEDNSASICFILAQLSHCISNLRNSVITLKGQPKFSRSMFHIRVHVVDVVGITDQVGLQLNLCGQTWSSAPLRMAKNKKADAVDTGSPWIESRLVCKDLPESMYPSKCQLTESPPLAVDSTPAPLHVHIVKGSHVLGHGMVHVDEVSSLVVNDLLIKIDLTTGHSADVRLFVTVVPVSSVQQDAPQNVHIELAGFSRTKEITDQLVSHLTAIGLDDTISVNVVQESTSVSASDLAAVGFDWSKLLRSGDQPLGKFSCTWLGNGGVFDKEVPGTLVITHDGIYFFKRDLSKALDFFVDMIAENGLKKVRHRLSDSAISMQLFGEAGETYATSLSPSA